jgi:WD40 repeat protein
VLAVAVSATGEVFSGDTDGAVRRWRSSGKKAGILYRHDSCVRAVAVNATGEVFSSGDDGTVRRWRPGDKKAESLYRHNPGVTAMAVTERGEILFSGFDAGLYILRSCEEPIRFSFLADASIRCQWRPVSSPFWRPLIDLAAMR